MEELEDSILHPLATLDWEECTPLPLPMSHPQCVLLHDVLYVGGNLEHAWDKTKLFVSKTSGKGFVWKVCPTPTYYYALTTYHSQLVLVGGLDNDSKQPSSKIWTLSSTAGMKWCSSIIREMRVKRWEASAVNTGNPERLVVAGGMGVNNSVLDTVEVFTGKEWCTVESLPRPCSYLKCALHEGKYYLCGGNYEGSNVYICDVKLLLKSCDREQSDRSADKSPLPPLWGKFQVPLKHSSIASFGQHLIAIGGKQLTTSADVVALSPFSQLWLRVGKLPIALTSSASIVLPTGELVVVGGHTEVSHSARVYMATLRVSPYDPDSRFSMNSLSRLEERGFNIVKALAGISAQLAEVLGVAERDQGVEVIIKEWVSGEHPITWGSLLDTLSVLHLKDLSQEIEDYMHGKFKYLNAYHRILATQESIDMWFVKIIFLGPPSTGKTTARRRLGDEIADLSSSGETEQQPSTGTVESSIVIRNLSSNTALVTPSQWSVSRDLMAEENVVLQFFNNYTREKKGFHTLTASDSDTDRSTVRASVCSNISATSSPRDHPTDAVASEVSSSGRKMLSEVTQMFRNAAGNDIKHLFKDTAFLKLEDTGGQPEFMDMLAALTIGPALYLFFCRLIDDLQSNYTMSYLSSSGRSTKPVKSTYTVEEVLLTALASASCFGTNSTNLGSEEISANEDNLLTSCNRSFAYILGTHKDLVSEQQITEFDEKLQNTIQSAAFFQNFVQFSSQDKMILPIDNMHGGENEIKKLRQFLEDRMKKHFKKLSIPASWLVLSLCLRKREERTTSLHSVLLLASELGMKQREVKLALWFLHHYAGVLMYFPKLIDLKDTVICDTQIVYDSATNLIVNTFKLDSVSTAASERFRKTGQFTLDVIREATAQASGDYIPLLKLVKLLEHLNILAFITPSLSHKKEATYFMPCVLQDATHKELDKWWENNSSQYSPAPLFIRYDCGFSLIGVFPAMIANLAGNKSLQLVVDGIKKNRVRFRVMSGDYDTFTLISHPKYYAVDITREQGAGTPTHEVCSLVRGMVESALKKVASRMNYSFCARYQLSFECPSHPGRDHLCTVENSTAVASPKRSSFVLFLDHPCLDMKVKWDDSYEIARRMTGWEKERYSHFELSETDIDDITMVPGDLEGKRREVLKRWQRKLGSKATYGNLLEVFVKSGRTECIDTLCDILKKKCDEKDALPRPPPGEMLCLKRKELLHMQDRHLVWFGKPFESSENEYKAAQVDSEQDYGSAVTDNELDIEPDDERSNNVSDLEYESSENCSELEYESSGSQQSSENGIELVCEGLACECESENESEVSWNSSASIGEPSKIIKSRGCGCTCGWMVAMLVVLAAGSVLTFSTTVEGLGLEGTTSWF